MSSHRILRVRELLKREIGEVLRREISVEEAGLITVNEVQVTTDLRSATVYVGVIGSEAQKKKALSTLEAHRKHIQALLGHAIVLKYTPQLRFVVDDSIARGNHVLEIIAELEKDVPPPA